MNSIEKDILTVESGVIVQSVNCCGPMGGLAGAIKRKWPIVETSYLKLLKSEPKDENYKFLGTTQLVSVNYDQLFVCNLFGQLNISTKERQTDYCAIWNGLKSIKNYIFTDEEIYFPYQFGCGLGGGDWQIISHMINSVFPNCNICKLPE